MNCPFCQEPLDAGAGFCGACGKELSESKVAMPLVGKPQDSSAESAGGGRPAEKSPRPSRRRDELAQVGVQDRLELGRVADLGEDEAEQRIAAEVGAAQLQRPGEAGEDGVLFPMADRMVGGSRQGSVRTAFAEAEAQNAGRDESHRDWAERLSAP